MRNTAHGARAENDNVGRIASARRRCCQVERVMHCGRRAGPGEQSFNDVVTIVRRQTKLVAQHSDAAVGDAQLHPAASGTENGQQAKRVWRPASAGDTNEDASREGHATIALLDSALKNRLSQRAAIVHPITKKPSARG